jgi:hypothetical protein
MKLILPNPFRQEDLRQFIQVTAGCPPNKGERWMYTVVYDRLYNELLPFAISFPPQVVLGPDKKAYLFHEDT